MCSDMKCSGLVGDGWFGKGKLVNNNSIAWNDYTELQITNVHRVCTWQLTRSWFINSPKLLGVGIWNWELMWTLDMNSYT